MTDIDSKSKGKKKNLHKKQKKILKNDTMPKSDESSSSKNLHKPDGNDDHVTLNLEDNVDDDENDIVVKKKVSEMITNFKNESKPNKPYSDSDSKVNKKKRKSRDQETMKSDSDSKLKSEDKSPKKKKKLKRAIQPEPDPNSDDSDSDEEKSKTPMKKKKLQNYDHVMTDDERERTIFVNNLPLSVTKRDIAKVFAECGQIETVRIRSAIPKEGESLKKVAVIKQQYSEESKQNLNAYVKFVKKSDAEKAEKKNGVLFGGHRLQVDGCQKNLKYDNKRSVFIGNLTFNAKEDDLFSHFADCGEIERVRLIRDKITGVGKGIGFVIFKDPGSVELALKLNGENFDNRPLRINRIIKKEKKGRKFFGNFRKFKKNSTNSGETSTNSTKISSNSPDKSNSGDKTGKSLKRKTTRKPAKNVGKMPKTFMT